MTADKDYAEFKIRGDTNEWYWHVSRPGRPGDQSDTFPTFEECYADLRRNYPVAVENNGNDWLFNV
jgi:hypothetical protein